MKFGTREIILAVVMLGLLASSYFLVFEKANQKRANLQQEIERKQRSLAELRQQMSGTDNVQTRLAELRNAINFFEEKLPQGREIHKILDEVSELARNHALQTQTIKTNKAERSSNYSEQPVLISLSGDFYDFYAFLQELENLPRLNKVLEMDLTKINEKDGSMTASMTMNVFFEPDTASRPQGDGASAGGATASAG